MYNKIFKNKSILITGGTGSFGHYFIKEILSHSKPKKIIIFSRDEFKQYLMENSNSLIKKNENIVRFFVGDVRDKDRLNFALGHDVDYVIHAAALKQVPTAEFNPFETVKTNVNGAQNVIESALENNAISPISFSSFSNCTL